MLQYFSGRDRLVTPSGMPTLTVLEDAMLDIIIRAFI
jgi:hypothetical protein